MYLTPFPSQFDVSFNVEPNDSYFDTLVDAFFVVDIVRLSWCRLLSIFVGTWMPHSLGPHPRYYAHCSRLHPPVLRSLR